MGNNWPSIKSIKNSAAGKNVQNANLAQVEATASASNFKGNTNTHNRGSEAKNWMLFNIQHWCNERALTLETEYKFHPDRKWRADFALPGLFTIIEYEGIYSATSSHTHFTGYNEDLQKYNAASILGLKVLRYTNANYKNVLRDLTEIHYHKTIPF